MTEIRIRHEFDSYPVSLGDVPFFDTEKVIDHLKRWGVRFTSEEIDTTDLTGEFVVDGNVAYFEVMVGHIE